LFAVVIYRSAVAESTLTRWLSRPVPVLLGEASYAMYILHWPLKSLFKGAARQLGIGEGLFFWIYLAATIAISIGVFVWIENPSRRWLRRKLGAGQG
jgi:peptidoglycan/LPS O-acetylase OafA/YrhL